MTKKDFIYEAPEVSVMELHNEGVLCGSLGDGSGDATNEVWETSELW
mgnify:CR=1 FL=1